MKTIVRQVGWIISLSPLYEELLRDSESTNSNDPSWLLVSRILPRRDSKQLLRWRFRVFGLGMHLQSRIVCWSSCHTPSAWQQWSRSFQTVWNSMESRSHFIGTMPKASSKSWRRRWKTSTYRETASAHGSGGLQFYRAFRRGNSCRIGNSAIHCNRNSFWHSHRPKAFAITVNEFATWR